MSFAFSAGVESKHICVIGDIMLDHYMHGNCDRISPEAPVPVVDLKWERYTLGGAGNVLENLIALNCHASLISVCGNDAASKIAVNELTKANPEFYHLVTDESRKTTIKTRVIAGNHQLIRLDNEDKHNIEGHIEEKIISHLAANVGKINAVILSDYRKGVLTATLIKAIIDLCKQHHIITIVDTKLADLSAYYGANLIKPNKKEAAIATGIKITDDETLLLACKQIANITGCSYVVVTLSEDGLAIYNKGVFTKMPTRSLAVSDVTGAGDTVVSALAYGLVNGLSIEQACNLANHAAAIVVGKVGSATATISEIEQSFLKQEGL